jgi:DNA-binding CsgD family transcriptional regulator/tetratricopeptide (TPR) repeat protein
MTDLIERAEALDVLVAARRAMRSGGGTVLVAGEAGVGKTALVEAALRDSTDRVLRGACEPLFTARPLGPFLDMAASLPPGLAATITGLDRVHHAIVDLVAELSARPSIVVVEDVHWADKATLDLVALLGRRMVDTRSLLVVTYRNDEFPVDHPLRQVLAALAGRPGVARIRLQPLSVDGVAALSGRSRQSARALHQRTGGNPFFLAEVLADPCGTLPESVSDAVLGRVARLDPLAQRLLANLSIVAGTIGLPMVRALGGLAADRLDELLMSSMLVQVDRAVAFRHELVRETVMRTLDPIRSLDLHRLALGVLIEAQADPAVIAHHAEAAGDADAVRRYAREAADAAVRVGSHREAAAQYGRAIRAGEPNPALEAELLELGGHQTMLSDRFDRAVEWMERAVAIRRELGDQQALSTALRKLSRVQSCYGRFDDADKSVTEALDAVVDLPDSIAYAMARSCAVATAWVRGDLDAAVADARRGLDAAARLGDAELRVVSMLQLGSIQLQLGDDEGWANLLDAAQLAIELGDTERAGNAYLNLLDSAARQRRHDVIDEHGERALSYCNHHGLDLWSRYLEGSVARSLMDRGCWVDATAALPLNLDASSSPLPRVGASVVLGVIRARRGDAGARAALGEAWELSEGTNAEIRACALNGLLEAAWLGLVPAPDRAVVVDVIRLTVVAKDHLSTAEALWWAQRHGIELGVEPRCESPWWLMLEARFAEAASAWHALDAPYEEALARCFTGDPGELQQGLATLDRLGASAARAAIVRDLRVQGDRAIPRGPRATTRANPFALTGRELEVARLVAEGLTNNEVAERLYVSAKTVDHHVSAVLAKVGVGTRAAVAPALARHGIGSRAFQRGRSR